MRNKHNNIDIRSIIFALLAILPGLVRIIVENISKSESIIYKSLQGQTDFFYLVKARYLYFLVIFMIGIIIYDWAKNKIDLKSILKNRITIVFIGYLFFVTLSALFTEYKDIALWGIYSRYEGWVTVFSYIVVFIFSLLYFNKERFYKFIQVLSIVTIYISVIGLLQYFKIDPFQWRLVQYTYLPTFLMRNIEQLNFKFGEGAAYSTLYNPNYIGSFVVLVIPILAYYSNKMKTNLWNFIVALSIVLSVVLIFAARSSAGILALGFIIVAVIFVSLFGRSFKRYRLRILIGILIFTSIFGLTFKNSIIILAKDIFEPFKTLEELETKKFIDKLENNGKYFTFSFSNGKELNIQLNDKNTPMYYDNDWNDLTFDYDKEKNILTFHNNDYNFIRIKYFNDNVIGIAKRSSEYYLSQSRGYVYVKMRYLNSHPVNHYNEKIKNYDNIPRIELLDGYERVGSGRGYIWSRSIPLTYDSWFIGSGPDSFILEFPQNDIYGKTNYMNVPQIIVDKPHNMFLGMAINTGVISLLLFLTGVLSILWKAVKHTGNKQFLIFSTISILAFLITGLFNDSIVAIMPIFYLILGSMLSITSSNKFD